MKEKKLGRGRVIGVSFDDQGGSYVHLMPPSTMWVSADQGDVARTAMREGREVEIVFQETLEKRRVHILSEPPPAPPSGQKWVLRRKSDGLYYQVPGAPCWWGPVNTARPWSQRAYEKGTRLPGEEWVALDAEGQPIEVKECDQGAQEVKANMGEKVLLRGLLDRMMLSNFSFEVWIGGQCSGGLSSGQVEKAIAAMRERCEVEVVKLATGERIVRALPKVVVKARGHVDGVWRGLEAQGDRALIASSDRLTTYRVWGREAMLVAAQAMANQSEIEVVSIDGGPDIVRVCS